MLPDRINSRRYGYTGERLTCACHRVDAAMHEQHGKPKNRVGEHWNPKCPHSELYAHTVLYPALRARLAHTKAKARTLVEPMRRVVGS